MRVFITQKERVRRLVAVRCPCCGGRILDAAYGVAVTFDEEGPHELPDYVIKCWRCKHLLGMKEAEGKGETRTEGRSGPNGGSLCGAVNSGAVAAGAVDEQRSLP